MEIKEYTVMRDSECRHWWYRGLHSLVLKTLSREHYSGKGKLRLLDAGCGTGGMLSRIPEDFNSTGIDMSTQALKFYKERKLPAVTQANIQQLPFKNESFHCLVSLDVLCHSAVNNDLHAINEFYRVLKPGGILILNLPAHDWLRSKHDKAVHTKHRYSLAEVRKKLSGSGFTVKKLTYRNSILFPLLMTTRLAGKFFPRNKTHASDLKKTPDFFNNLFYNILDFENRAIGRMNLPLGLSIFCIAQK